MVIYPGWIIPRSAQSDIHACILIKYFYTVMRQNVPAIYIECASSSVDLFASFNYPCNEVCYTLCNDKYHRYSIHFSVEILIATIIITTCVNPKVAIAF